MMRDLLDQLPKADDGHVVKQVLSGEGLVGRGSSARRIRTIWRSRSR
jgi:hypothetical protein